jgi:hypothetical protein
MKRAQQDADEWAKIYEMHILVGGRVDLSVEVVREVQVVRLNHQLTTLSTITHLPLVAIQLTGGQGQGLGGKGGRPGSRAEAAGGAVAPGGAAGGGRREGAPRGDGILFGGAGESV